MKKSPKKLGLNRETVRNLDDASLKSVAGGESVLIRCGWTKTCAAVCPSADNDCVIGIIKL